VAKLHCVSYGQHNRNKTLEANTDTTHYGRLAEGENLQVRRFLFRSSASRRAQCFTARSYSSGRSMHPLRDGGGFSILYRRRGADEKITGTSTAIKRDEQEDGPEGKDGGE
jgi:hypothetical protein